MVTQMFVSLILSTACAALSPQRGWAPKDTTQQSKSALDSAVVEAPCVVLVRPHLDVNIGAVARAMANFGLADLRLVAPFPGDENMERCDWRSEAALQRACGAGEILERARAFDTLPEALGDIHRAFATSARLRGLNTKCISSRHPTPRKTSLASLASRHQRAAPLRSARHR